MIAYLENRKVFPDYPDVLTTQEVSKITGYGKTAINNWCNQGHIRTPQGFSIWRKIRDLHTAEIEGGAEKKYYSIRLSTKLVPELSSGTNFVYSLIRGLDTRAV